MPIRELQTLVQTRQVSPVELAETFLVRLETLGPQYNAVVTVTRERALQQARQAERDIAAGYYKGPLHGIPYGAKDLLATSGGIPTTWGAAPLRHQTFDYDATVVRKLGEAGAVLVAKLAMVELAGGMGYRQPHASFTGPALNPWDRTAWSGGSSSGSGAAVGAGLVPFAIGSETWGSILSPASNCGIAGLRPTYGRVSRYGAMTLSWSLDKLGPMGLTADDCGLVLEAIAGPDPLDLTATNRTFTYTANSTEKRWRLGVLKNITADVDKAVRNNFAQTLQVLGQVASIEEITLPALPYEEITRIIVLAEAASAFEEFIESGKAAGLTAPEDHYGPYVRMTVLAKDYIRALRLRGIIARQIDAVLAGFDALVGPARATPAPRLEQELRSAAGGTAKDIMGAIGNALGLPAVTVPNGFSDTGLSTGVQFMGRAYDENTILAVARSYQRLTTWHLCHPPDLEP
jgi:aspartyl-tRNA(Asn)/glutamyl-tRNA(Gln) amidotransferase subunit A